MKQQLKFNQPKNKKIKKKKPIHPPLSEFQAGSSWQLNRERIVEILKIAKKAGYRSFISKDKNCSIGYIVSNNNVLHIRRRHGAYSIIVEYVPSRRYGSGSLCLDYLTEVTVEIIKEAEKIGEGFIFSENIRKYRNPMYFIDNYFEKLIEI